MEGVRRPLGGPVVVLEGSDAILPCSPINEDSLVKEVFDWKKNGPARQEVFLYAAGIHYNNGRTGQDEQFRGRVSHFPDELEFGNASIIIRNTKISDSGNYSCIFPHLRPAGQTFNVKLVVGRVFKDKSEEVIGAAPKPDLWIVNTTESGAVLKCKVTGAFPKPTVEWQDSDGNVLPAEEDVSLRGDRYYLTVFTTVNKTTTNRFRCVATQEEISHRIAEEIYVMYYENLLKDTCGNVSIGWLFASGVLGAVILAAIQAVLVGTKIVMIHFKGGSCLKLDGSGPGANECEQLKQPLKERLTC